MSFSLSKVESSHRPENTGQSLKSSSFSSRKDPQTKWCLKVYPKGEDNQNEDLICYLCLRKSNRKQLRVKSNFVLTFADQTISQELEMSDFQIGMGWGVDMSVKVSQINERNRQLSSDELKIYCEVFVNEISKNFIQKKPQKTLLKDMKSLFESQIHSDVDIVIGTNKLRAHKLILSMRSTVFEKMFEHPMKESLNNEVIIDDINEDIFKEVLRFIYTDNAIFENFNSGSQLLNAAEKYQLIDLKDKCEEYLISQLSTKTVCDAFVLADIYSVKKLKNSAIEFIKNNSFDVMKNQNWIKVFKRPDLLNQLI